MTVIDLTTEIAAPIERVFDLARDLEAHAASMAHTGERAVAGRTAGLVEAGDTVTWRARHFGLWWSLTSRVTVVEAPSRFEDVQERGPFAWFCHEHRFEAVDGLTRMHDHWEHRSPFGPLGRLVDGLVLGRYMRSLLEARNEALKQLAEPTCRTDMTTTTSDPRLLVLYDADCGICARSARLLRRLDGGRRLRLVPLQATDAIVGAPPVDVLLDAIHVRDSDGSWSSAGAAWIRIAGEVPALRPLAILGRAPATRLATELVYALVSRNRRRLSRLIGDQACDVGSRTP